MQGKIKTKMRKKLNTEFHKVAGRDNKCYYNNIYEDIKDGNNTLSQGQIYKKISDVRRGLQP